MKKVWAILCTLSFSAFWVFGGLSIMAWMDAHPLMPHVLVISLLGGAVGIWSRLRLAQLTQDLQRGKRVLQAEA